MSRIKRLILEIHRRSLWQVLLVYVGGALVAYQAVQALTEGLGLPEWFPGLAVVLFIIGLPFVVATAFVREVAPPAAAPPEAAPAILEPEATAPRIEARRRRRFLTWRNTGLSFVVALAVWGVVATGWLLLADGTELEGMEAAQETRKSLAVLPFVNLSADPTNEYFSDGVTVEIIDRLTKIADLKVISRTSSFLYKNGDLSLRAIADELGVSAVVEGEVRRIGDRVRINAQLIDAHTDEHLWSEQYDRELTDVFAIQSDVAEQVATALRATLTSAERERIAERPTENLEAYDYYLRGLEFMGRSFNERDTRIALEMFENATRVDSSFARAYAKLSQAHSRAYWLHLDRSRQRLQQAKRAVDRSLEFEPDLPEAHEALGYYYYWGHLDYERALQEFETALSQQPGNSDLFAAMGYVERRRGNFRAALSHFQKALELDPREALITHDVADTHGQLLRNYPEAERYYDRVLALAPDFTGAYRDKAWLYICWEGNTSRARAVFEEAAGRGLQSIDHPALGYAWVLVELFDGEYEAALARLSSGTSAAFSNQYWYIPKALLAARIYGLMNEVELARQHYDSAAALLEAGIQKAPDDSRLYGALGIAYAGLGRGEDAIRQAQRGVDLLPVSKEAWRGLYRVEELARIFTMTGRHDAALDRLEVLLSVPGDMSVARLRVDPAWDPLRSHPRFQTLLEKYEQQ